MNNLPPSPFVAGIPAAETASASNPPPAPDADARFILDEDRFLEEIEPLPLFLQAPVEVLHILAGHLR